MYFQNLENLKSNPYYDYIEKIDTWLASLSPMYHRNINPSDFARYYKMNYEIALVVFHLLCEKHVLKPKFIVKNIDGMTIEQKNNYSDLPKSIFDYEYNTEVVVTDSNTELWFELIDYPKEFAPVLTSMKKHSESSIRISDLVKQKSSTMNLFKQFKC